jgi:hypothetical protein
MDEQKTTLSIPVDVRRKLKCLAAQHNEPMYKTLERCVDVYPLIEYFLGAFWGVFESDWPLTRERMQDDAFIARDGTFLHPGVEDAGSDWWHRESLLAAYRALHAYVPAPSEVQP